jgi:hypothetical protein
MAWRDEPAPQRRDVQSIERALSKGARRDGGLLQVHAADSERR